MTALLHTLRFHSPHYVSTHVFPLKTLHVSHIRWVTYVTCFSLIWASRDIPLDSYHTGIVRKNTIITNSAPFESQSVGYHVKPKSVRSKFGNDNRCKTYSANHFIPHITDLLLKPFRGITFYKAPCMKFSMEISKRQSHQLNLSACLL
jgi:hypothetical protein